MAFNSVTLLKISPYLLALAVVCGALASAQAKDKDLRTQSEAWGEAEISFCARPSPNAFGFPGHAFVSFSEQPRGQPRTFRAVGHTVAPSAKLAQTVFTYFGGASVAGRQAEERYTALKQACLTVQVNRAVYQKALDAARPTLSALGISDGVAASLERYSLNENDCIDFTLKIAQQLKSAGLNIPARQPTDTPASYIAKLMSANNYEALCCANRHSRGLRQERQRGAGTPRAGYFTTRRLDAADAFCIRLPPIGRGMDAVFTLEWASAVIFSMRLTRRHFGPFLRAIRADRSSQTPL